MVTSLIMFLGSTIYSLSYEEPLFAASDHQVLCVVVLYVWGTQSTLWFIQWIGLVGKIKKPETIPIFPWNTYGVVRFQFSLKPIHWFMVDLI